MVKVKNVPADEPQNQILAKIHIDPIRNASRHLPLFQIGKQS
jgi:hypothetical protein